MSHTDTPEPETPQTWMVMKQSKTKTAAPVSTVSKISMYRVRTPSDTNPSAPPYSFYVVCGAVWHRCTLTCRCHNERSPADTRCNPSHRCHQRSSAGSCISPSASSTAACWSLSSSVLPFHRESDSDCSSCSPPRPFRSRDSPTSHRSVAPV